MCADSEFTTIQTASFYMGTIQPVKKKKNRHHTCTRRPQKAKRNTAIRRGNSNSDCTRQCFPTLPATNDSTRTEREDHHISAECLGLHGAVCCLPTSTCSLCRIRHPSSVRIFFAAGILPLLPVHSPPFSLQEPHRLLFFSRSMRHLEKGCRENQVSQCTSQPGPFPRSLTGHNSGAFWRRQLRLRPDKTLLSNRQKAQSPTSVPPASTCKPSRHQERRDELQEQRSTRCFRIHLSSLFARLGDRFFDFSNILKTLVSLFLKMRN